MLLLRHDCYAIAPAQKRSEVVSIVESFVFQLGNQNRQRDAMILSKVCCVFRLDTLFSLQRNSVALFVKLGPPLNVTPIQPLRPRYSSLKQSGAQAVGVPTVDIGAQWPVIGIL